MVISVKPLFAIGMCVLLSNTAFAQVDLVKVDKSKRRLYLIENNTIIQEYRIALGKKPHGHKQEEGDQRTPEGRYILDGVNPNSHFYKSIHISYPNQDDIDNSKRRHINPGGNISIHGLKNNYRGDPAYIQSFDWTNGCIAITNQEMDEFLRLVKNGTPIEIEW